VALPQARTLTDADGFRWLVTVDAGRLVLESVEGQRVVFERPEELRWFGLQAHRAAVEYDQEVQHAAARASAARRQRRINAGEPVGHRNRPFIDPPEPPLNLDPAIVGGVA
jgi:hypothetical protein